MDMVSGRQIASELLSIILHANFLGLQVSEIEGDAILFYKYGPPPKFQQIMKQYELMLIAFKKRLRELHGNRKLSNLELSLKSVVHFGPIAEYKLYGFKKLYGEVILEAHQLLKNNIPSHSYILATQDLLNEMQKTDELLLPQWVKVMDVPTGRSATDLSFTCFLYDTEILKANVLQDQKNRNRKYH
jgi:hypothetical protein